MSARFLVTVYQYQGVFANSIAHRPGPNLKSGSQTSVRTRRIFILSSVIKKLLFHSIGALNLPFLAGHFVEPEQTVGFGSTHPPKLCLRRREVPAQQGDRIDDGMEVNNDLAAYPIDVVTTFAAQRPRHSRERARVCLLTVVLVGRDVAILAKRTPHVARGEEDRARPFGAAVEQLLPSVMEIRAYPRSRGEFAC